MQRHAMNESYESPWREESIKERPASNESARGCVQKRGDLFKLDLLKLDLLDLLSMFSDDLYMISSLSGYFE